MRKLFGFGLFAAALSLGLPSGADAHESDLAGLIPADAQARLAELSAQAGIDTIWRQAREHALAAAIDPDDYVCGPTDFDYWIGGEFGAIENWDAFYEIVVYLGAMDWATYYSLLFDHDASDDYMGVNGEQTQEMQKRHKDAPRFWNRYSPDIQLQGMHGADLADDAKMQPVVQFLLGVDEDLAAVIIDYVQAVIEADAGLGYDSPLWSLNAFAASSRGEPAGSPFEGIPNKIVMGDGISEMLVDVGLGDNGPDYVYAHEFAHHVQYDLGLFDDYYDVAPEDLPEFTRKHELMADAFGAYYCAHARGAAFQAKRVIEAFTAAYIVGDCAFDYPGHHGTPNQREAASRWGADVASSAGKQGKINSAETMLELFEAQLPTLIAPDAP